jgi:hypothetical protein
MPNKLTPEDQARVDKVTHTGVNSTERQPFRVWTLLGVILLVLTLLSLFSFWLASFHGVV